MQELNNIPYKGYYVLIIGNLYLYKKMKHLSLIIYMLTATLLATAQKNSKKEVFAFIITDYIVTANDSMTIVQLQLPKQPNISIDVNQVAILKHNYTNVKEDTARVGWGKCDLVKGTYRYFGIRLYKKINKPLQSDIIYTAINYPAKYKGLIYGLVKNAVYINRVTGESFYAFNTPAVLNEQTENNLIDSLVADIKYTATQMLQQNDGQDQPIKDGIFSGKKLFAAMQTATNNNVKDFIAYIIARPQIYAGNSWKMAEIFATWMTAGTPTVVKNNQ